MKALTFVPLFASLVASAQEPAITKVVVEESSIRLSTRLDTSKTHILKESTDLNQWTNIAEFYAKDGDENITLLRPEEEASLFYAIESAEPAPIEDALAGTNTSVDPGRPYKVLGTSGDSNSLYILGYSDPNQTTGAYDALFLLNPDGTFSLERPLSQPISWSETTQYDGFHVDRFYSVSSNTITTVSFDGTVNSGDFSSYIPAGYKIINARYAKSSSAGVAIPLGADEVFDNGPLTYHRFLCIPGGDVTLSRVVEVPEFHADKSVFSIEQIYDAFVLSGSKLYVGGRLYTCMADPSITESSAYIYQVDINTGATAGYTVLDNVNDPEVISYLFESATSEGGVDFVGYQHTDVSTSGRDNRSDMFCGSMSADGTVRWVKALGYEGRKLYVSHVQASGGNTVLFCINRVGQDNGVYMTLDGLFCITLNGSGAFTSSHLKCASTTKFGGTSGGNMWAWGYNNLNVIQAAP